MSENIQIAQKQKRQTRLAKPGRPEWEFTNAIPNAVAILDEKGRIVFVNSAWGKHSKAELLAGERYVDACRQRGHEVFLPSADTVATGLDAVLCGNVNRFACEYSVSRKAGRKHRFSLTIMQSPDGRGGAVVSHADLGEESVVPAPAKTLLQTLLSEATDAVFVCDRKERLVLANPATSHWAGLDLALHIGEPVASVVGPELAAFLLDRHEETLKVGKSYIYEGNAQTVHGLRSFDITKGVYRSPKGKIQGVFTVARDITERKAMEREIIEATDTEKQRLGQELHENLCQYLVGISLLGNVLFEDLLRLELHQAEDARQITTLVKDAIAEVRALAKGLAPMPDEQEEGLICALQELANQARTIGKVRCTVRLPRAISFINPTTGVHLFRIAQEAVYNAIKHAKAKRLGIALSTTPRAITLTVEDDGIGISADVPSSPEISSHLGLHIMKYRSRAIGAELTIAPRTKVGTVVTCILPRR